MKSNLKITSFLLVVFINLLSGFLFFIVLIKPTIQGLNFYTIDQQTIFIWLLILLLEVFALYFLSQLKLIRIEKDRVLFKSFFFPFIRKERLFSYYDFSKLVDEKSKTGYYESIWLFKDGKLEDEISSFYYSNYKKIKFELKVQNKGKLKINNFKQMHLKFGGKL